MFSAITSSVFLLFLALCVVFIIKDYYQAVISYVGQYGMAGIILSGYPLLQVYLITVVIAMLCFLSAQDAEKKCKEMSQKEFLWWLPFFYIPVFNLVVPCLWLLDRYQRRKTNV